MKKLIILSLLVMTATSAFADRYIETKIGINGFGSYNYDGHNETIKQDTKGVGVDFSVELLASVNNNLYLGGGIAYQVNQENKKEDDPLFRSVPIYGTAKYNLGYIGDSAWIPYLKANLGYSFNMKDSGNHSPDDGLYWALGGGVENDGVLLEIAYQDTYSEVIYKDYDYSRWTFSIGYRFKNL
jgi:hypothetical protein